MRPGEKMFEELVSEKEGSKLFETEDMLIVPPQIELPDINLQISDYQNAVNSKLNRYTSRDVKSLSKEEINVLLLNCSNDK